MDLAEIEVFGTLMRVGSTVETARVLRLSQPAVSDRLKRLEARLGFLLFQRKGNRLEPTAEALDLYPETVAVFAAQKEIRDIAASMLELVKNIEGNPFKHTIEAFGH